MKKTETIKNLKFHQQLKGEKVQEMTIMLLLNDSNNKIIYDIACCNNKKQLNDRIKEIDINKIKGLCYIAVTNNYSFIEYKRVIIKENK